MRKRKTARTLLAELHEMMDTGRVDPQRVIEYVRKKAKQPRGRPAIDPGKRRSVVVTARLSIFERHQLDKILVRRKETLSEFVRSVIVQHSGAPESGARKRDSSSVNSKDVEA